MSALLLKKLIIFSRIQRSAKVVEFDPQMTVITGSNQVGKSRILKSIYYALGAEIELGPRWKTAEAKYILFVTINEKPLIFYRDGTLISILHAESLGLVLKSRSATKALGPFMAKLFGFNLTLQSRSGDRVVPPPAFMYLPYYIDQEKGWSDLFRSFERLGQFSDWQTDLVDYHTGIRGSAYYTTKSEVDDLKKKIDVLSADLRIAKSMREKAMANKRMPRAPIDMNKYIAEIKMMLGEITKLNTSANKLKQKLVAYNARSIEIEQQRTIVKASLNELNSDYKALLGSPDKIECPTCGQSHGQDFMQRFSIAKDEERCIDLMTELDDEMVKNKGDIQETQGEYDVLMSESHRIQAILDVKKEEVSLNDIVDDRCDERVAAVIAEQVSSIDTAISVMEDQRMELNKKLQGITDPIRTKAIVSYLQDRVTTNSIEMNVTPPGDDAYNRARITLSSDGSERPRALLACFYGYIQTIIKYGDSRSLPVVIDSPLQQEQDQANTLGVLGFIAQNPIPGHQIILGTVAECGVKFPGKIMQLVGEKYELLSKGEFQALQPTIDRIALAAVQE